MSPRPRNKPCVHCGTPIFQHGPPCGTPPPTTADRRRRKLFIETWIQQYGPVCAGWNRDLHTVDPSMLEADHVISRNEAGELSELQALCKSCNSTKRDGWR